MADVTSRLRAMPVPAPTDSFTAPTSDKDAVQVYRLRLPPGIPRTVLQGVTCHIVPGKVGRVKLNNGTILVIGPTGNTHVEPETALLPVPEDNVYKSNAISVNMVAVQPEQRTTDAIMAHNGTAILNAPYVPRAQPEMPHRKAFEAFAAHSPQLEAERLGGGSSMDVDALPVAAPAAGKKSKKRKSALTAGDVEMGEAGAAVVEDKPKKKKKSKSRA
ncbi:hypothetical protein AMAG_16318 [Allomyces macrogynus ATCC 38327]|uniref:Uncharacterized protein n=1 Tax=Allomyces macrogynus (strain ATCC 38327) TaxID=578462 RepID=A0A0L0TAZ5_ALLM3|nr:hypothetical protein AMAG_16318 [Allomyces macrogynus ATCC 38327]|eukprot:KNE71890.1 hypothetical protein AMAG_16318 [Allomyces macrogynus ATCC 38327]